MASSPAGKLLRCISIVAATLVLAMPAAAQTVRIATIDPGAGSTLATGDAVYVHIRYSAGEPVRFRGHAYRGGQRQTAGLRSNPAPPYPAGEGEAVVWLEFIEPTVIDTLEVSMLDESWQPIERLEVPLRIEWQAAGRAERRARPAWAASLSAEQQQMVSTTSQSGAGSAGVLFGLLMFLAAWSVPGYFVLQILAYRGWRDGWRKAGLAPLLITVPILLYTVLALLAGSNLWPLIMLFTYPLAFLYLLLLTVVRRLAGS